MVWSWSIFLPGAVGALAPEIVKLYEIRSDPSRFTFSWFYAIMSLLFVALGGFVALILPAANAQGAFYAGISTPVLITTVMKNASRSGRKLKSIAASGPLSPFKSFVSAL
jgi:hypothetical protein